MKNKKAFNLKKPENKLSCLELFNFTVFGYNNGSENCCGGAQTNTCHSNGKTGCCNNK